MTAHTPVEQTGMNDHGDRPVSVIERPEGGHRIAKRYVRADGVQIFHEHEALWASHLGAAREPAGIPEPISWDPTTKTVTMEMIAGNPIGARGDLGDTVRHVAGVAALLVDLHTSGVQVARRRTAAAIVRSCQRKTDEIGVGSMRNVYFSVVTRLAMCAPDDELLVVNHGDFSPRNVLYDGERLALIDFDRLQMASPARDIAYWGAWAWATQRLGVQRPSWAIGDQLIEHYTALDPARSAEITAALPFHRAASLLRIVHGWSALRSRTEVAAALLGDARAVLSGAVRQ